MKPMTHGSSIYQAFKLVENFGTEVEALAGLIQNKIQDHVFDENESSVGYKIMGDWSWDTSYSDYKWILKQYWYVLPLSKKTARTIPSHHLFVFFDIAGDESSFDKIGNSEPLLHIWLITEYDGVFSIDPDEIVKWEDWQWKSNVLGCEKSEFDKGFLNEWLFTLRLTCINSPEDIDKKVINPLLNLLSNKYDDAIKYLENIDGIVRFVAGNNDSFSLVHSEENNVMAEEN